MKIFILILCLIICLVFIPDFAFAMQLHKNLNADFMIGALGGFENNVNLDSSRKGDAYTQEFLDSKLTFRTCDWFNLKFDYFLNNINYHEITDNSFLDNTIEPGFQLNLKDRLLLDGRYSLQIVDYYKNEKGEFTKNGASGNIRYYFTDKIFADAGYVFSFYEYDDFKARGADKVETTTTREDARHIIKGDLGIFVKRDVLLKLKGNYCFNDSNDKYNDYYDYEYFTIGASLTHPITKKLYGVWGGAYQRKEFDSRRSLDGTKIEDNDLFILNASLYYRFSPKFLFGATYTYLENQSNEPIQEYSDSIVTCGIYYSF